MTSQLATSAPQDMSRRTRALALIAIASAIVIVQGVFFLAFEPWRPDVVAHSSLLKSDAGQYEELARCLLDTGSFCDEALRTPGYPLFIAAVYALFGIRPWAVLLSQIGIAVASAAMVYALGHQLHSARVGLLAAGLWAFDPVSLLAPTMLMADGLFVLLLLCALNSYFAGLLRGRIRAGLACGLLLGLAALVRPVGQYFAIILAVAALAWPHRRIGWCTRFAVAVMIGFVLAVAPWSARNYNRFESIKLSTVQGITLLEWQVAGYLASNNDIPFTSAQESLRAEAATLGYVSGGNPFQNEAAEQKLALQYIRSDLVGFALASVRGMAFMYSNVGSTAILERLAHDSGVPTKSTSSVPVATALDQLHPGARYLAARLLIAGVVLTTFAAQWILFFIGARSIWREGDHFLLGLVLAWIAYITLTSGVFGVMRYRMPAAPFVLLVAAVGLNSLIWRRTPDAPSRDATLRRL